MKHKTKSVDAVFDSHDEAERAVRELQADGVGTTKPSIVGKNYHTEERVVGYYLVGDRMTY